MCFHTYPLPRSNSDYILSFIDSFIFLCIYQTLTRVHQTLCRSQIKWQVEVASEPVLKEDTILQGGTNI